MKELVCPNCEHKNAAGTRFCQRCGQSVMGKKSLADQLRSLKPESLTGANPKQMQLGALFCIQTKDTVEQVGEQLKPTAVPVDPMPDGRWYCPDCVP